VYAAGALLSALDVGEAAIRETLPAALAFLARAGLAHTELGLLELFALLLFASATLGSRARRRDLLRPVGGVEPAGARPAAEIDATLPRTVAFMYALSRSGMAFPA